MNEKAWTDMGKPIPYPSGQVPKTETISGRIVIPAAPLIARFGEPVDVPLEAA
jgi:hypothetical protein